MPVSDAYLCFVPSGLETVRDRAKRVGGDYPRSPRGRVARTESTTKGNYRFIDHGHFMDLLCMS